MKNLYKNKSILITGATGLIGSNLTEKLMEYGDVKVTVLARNESKIKDLFAKHLNNNNFKYIIQDVTEPFKFTEEFDYIFHAAGAISGDVIRSFPVDIINANIEGTKNCLDYLKNQGKGRMIIFSSATVYGNCTGKDIVVQEKDTTVTDSLDSPVCPYSQSKRMVETLGKSYSKQYGVDVVIARFSYVYGFTKYYPNTAFFNFIKKALSGEDIILNGTSFARRDNIYVKDAIKFLLLVAMYGESSQSYNISSMNQGGNFAAIDEIAEKIVNAANEITGKYSKVEKKEFTESSRFGGIILDNAKILNLLQSSKSITTLQQGIFETVKTFYNNFN